MVVRGETDVVVCLVLDEGLGIRSTEPLVDGELVVAVVVVGVVDVVLVVVVLVEVFFPYVLASSLRTPWSPVSCWIFARPSLVAASFSNR